MTGLKKDLVKCSYNVFILCLLVVCISLSGMLSLNVSAASSKRKAVKAYKKMLSKETFKTNIDLTPRIRSNKLEFGTAYIDNDNIPELVVRRKDRKAFGLIEEIIVYTYYRGKVRQLEFIYGGKGISDSNGYYMQKPFYYKKTGVLFSSLEYGEQFFWVLSKSKIHTSIYYVQGFFTESGKTEYYDTNSKLISEAQFDNLKKELSKNKKPSYFRFHDNTSKNRKKYLK